MIESAAVFNEEKQEVTIFAVNRNISENLTLECNIQSFEGYHPLEHIVLENENLKAVNTLQSSPVVPHQGGASAVNGGILTSTLNKASWNVIRLGRN
jgi:alpha-N-arabinofuranosidase